VIRAVPPNFLRNGQPIPAQYTSERLEMTAQGEKSKKARTINQRKIKK
jgi:hypothetical protein